MDQVKWRGEQSYCSLAMLHIENARSSRKSYGRKIYVEHQVGSPMVPRPRVRVSIPTEGPRCAQLRGLWVRVLSGRCTRWSGRGWGRIGALLWR